MAPANMDVWAASRTKILSGVRARFRMNGMDMHAVLLLSDDVHEFMLVSCSGALWNFDNKTLCINGNIMPLKTKKSGASVCNIYVRETLQCLKILNGIFL